MKVAVSVSGRQDLPVLESLLGWLRSSTDLRVTGRDSPGHQGAVDIVDIVLSNAIALGSLLVSIRAWLGTRPRKPPITFQVGDVLVTLPDDSPESLAVLEKVIRAALEAGADDGD